MSITQTNLTAAIAANDVVMKVASGSGFPGVGSAPASNYLVRIDKEFMLAIAQPVSLTIQVAQRGYNGTIAAAHDTLAKVEVSSAPSDYADPGSGVITSLPPNLPTFQTIGQDITYTTAQVAAWGNQPQNFAITKATAAAIVLVAPSKAQDGEVLVFTSLTAAAHVITATTLLGDAVSGSPHTTATFAAFIGATITLQVQNGIYNVVSTTGVTIT